jgi:hypothetical protein
LARVAVGFQLGQSEAHGFLVRAHVEEAVARQEHEVVSRHPLCRRRSAGQQWWWGPSCRTDAWLWQTKVQINTSDFRPSQDERLQHQRLGAIVFVWLVFQRIFQVFWVLELKMIVRPRRMRSTN